MPHATPLSSSIELLNESFEISLTEAQELWLGGAAVSGREPNRFARSRVRISEDARWLIRRYWAKAPVQAIEAATAVAQSEFERLQDADINVVSRGMTVSPASASIFTVSPWIPYLQECPEDVFRTEINPKLDRYFGDTASGSVVLGDVDTRVQYSYSPTLGEHLLHDIDPNLARVTKA